MADTRSSTCTIIGAALMLVAAIWISGCSAYMAANQPPPKNFAVLKQGTQRSLVIAELGTPVHSEAGATGKKDIYKFTHGYHGAVRAGRAVAHGAASVATLGLWEVIGTPIEGYANGTELSVEVQYDPNDQVAQVIPLKGTEEINRNLADLSPKRQLARQKAQTQTLTTASTQ
ncbi:MAG: hypothetical protein AAGD43_01405 [Pseudomonadota bacterium]